MMKVAVLCGGEGKRIRELTKDIPKPLIEVAGKPILKHILDSYKAQGFGDLIFCVGYKGDKIVEFLNKNNGFKTTISDMGAKASMLQRIHAIRDQFEDNLLIGYGDTFVDLDTKDILESHEKSGKWVTILTTKIKSPFGLVTFESDGSGTSFQEKPILNYYIGYFIINKKAFDSISKNMLEMKDGDGLVSLFKHLIQINQLHVYEHKKTMLTFNTQEERDDVDKKLSHFYSYNEGK